MVNKILRASNHHEKEYIVSVDKAIDNDFTTENVKDKIKVPSKALKISLITTKKKQV